MKKGIFSVFLVICMFVTSGVFAFAADYQKNFHINRELSQIGVDVKVADDIGQKIPKFIVEDIIEDNPDAGAITIIEYKDFEEYNSISPLVEDKDARNLKYVTKRN